MEEQKQERNYNLKRIAKEFAAYQLKKENT